MILESRSDAYPPVSDDQKGFGKNYVDYIEEHLTSVLCASLEHETGVVSAPVIGHEVVIASSAKL